MKKFRRNFTRIGCELVVTTRIDGKHDPRTAELALFFKVRCLIFPETLILLPFASLFRFFPDE